MTIEQMQTDSLRATAALCGDKSHYRTEFIAAADEIDRLRALVGPAMLKAAAQDDEELASLRAQLSAAQKRVEGLEAVMKEEQRWIMLRREGEYAIVECQTNGVIVAEIREHLECNFSHEVNLTQYELDAALAGGGGG